VKKDGPKKNEPYGAEDLLLEEKGEKEAHRTSLKKKRAASLPVSPASKRGKGCNSHARGEKGRLRRLARPEKKRQHRSLPKKKRQITPPNKERETSHSELSKKRPPSFQELKSKQGGGGGSEAADEYQARNMKRRQPALIGKKKTVYCSEQKQGN